MKVKNLIDILNQVDSNAEVVLSSDAEGNGYSVLDEVDSGYTADLSRHWDVDLINYNGEGEPIVILYPI